MRKNGVKIECKQKNWSKFVWTIVFKVHKLKLISTDKALSIMNYTLRKGSFKYRVEKGEWKTIKIEGVSL